MMKYAKTVVAAVIAGAVALQTAITDGQVSASEAVTIGLAVLGALGVYAIPNVPAQTKPYTMRTQNTPPDHP